MGTLCNLPLRHVRLVFNSSKTRPSSPNVTINPDTTNFKKPKVTTMGLYNQLTSDLDEVDIIIAGGMY